MALNIKDPLTEKLAAEVAGLAGETKTRAIRVALEQRKERLLRPGVQGPDGSRLHRFLEDEAWPQIPAEALGAPPTRAEREKLLGYGPEGV